MGMLAGGRFALKSDVELEFETGLAMDDGADEWRLFPGGQWLHAPLWKVPGEHPLLVNGEQRTIRPVPDPRETLPDNGPSLDRADLDFDVVGESGGLNGHLDVRQRDAQDIGRRVQRLAVGHIEFLDDRGVDADVFGWPPHSHQVDEHGSTVDCRHIGRLVEIDAIDGLAESRHGRHEAFEHEPGVLAGGVEPGLARPAGVHECRFDVGTIGRQVVVGRRGDHAGPGRRADGRCPQHWSRRRGPCWPREPLRRRRVR